jgi:hypothetical protein
MLKVTAPKCKKNGWVKFSINSNKTGRDVFQRLLHALFQLIVNVVIKIFLVKMVILVIIVIIYDFYGYYDFYSYFGYYGYHDFYDYCVFIVIFVIMVIVVIMVIMITRVIMVILVIFMKFMRIIRITKNLKTPVHILGVGRMGMIKSNIKDLPKAVKNYFIVLYTGFFFIVGPPKESIFF